MLFVPLFIGGKISPSRKRKSRMKRSRLNKLTPIVMAMVLGMLVTNFRETTARVMPHGHQAETSRKELVHVREHPGAFAFKDPLVLRASARVRAALPRPVRFHEDDRRGLLIKAWINGVGAYTFAIDTGAGALILSRRVAAEARVAMEGGRALEIGGLSGQRVAAGRKASVRDLALGVRHNMVPAHGLIIVTENLPPDIDGILDPTEIFRTHGFVIDMPRGELSSFDAGAHPWRRSGTSEIEGTVMSWLPDGSSRRPFVMLSGTRRALLDTGSGFGLALTEKAARSLGLAIDRATDGGRARDGTRDMAGGLVLTKRLRPTTVSLGALELRGVPTDLLINADPHAPILLGRDALRPFQLAFDPVHRLIRIR